MNANTSSFLGEDNRSHPLAPNSRLRDIGEPVCDDHFITNRAPWLTDHPVAGAEVVYTAFQSHQMASYDYQYMARSVSKSHDTDQD